jgi:hypothetical protein
VRPSLSNHWDSAALEKRTRRVNNQVNFDIPDHHAQTRRVRVTARKPRADSLGRKASTDALSTCSPQTTTTNIIRVSEKDLARLPPLLLRIFLLTFRCVPSQPFVHASRLRTLPSTFPFRPAPPLPPPTPSLRRLLPPPPTTTTTTTQQHLHPLHLTSSK